MPPREIPGFYWDPQKNRYFPLHPASRLPPTSAASPSQLKFSSPQHQPPQTFNSPKASVIPSVYREISGALRAPPTLSRLARLRHQIFCSQVVKAPRPPPSGAFHTLGAINAFNIVQLQDDHTHTVIGDANCWLYSLSNKGDVAPMREFKLPSRISSITSSGTLSVTTTFGPPCKIVVQNAATAESFILSPGAKSVYDVWTSHLMGSSLALGMHGKGIFIPDVNSSTGFRALDTFSDVLAIHQESNLVYTGTRCGTIARYKASSITHLRTIGGTRLLVGCMDGRLELFDLRYPLESAPITSFSGHMNSYSQKLAFAVDPSERFIFAAGQDKVVRGWSVFNGQLLRGPEAETVAGKDVRLLNTKFEEGVSDIQIVEDYHGLHFWYSTGSTLCNQTIL